MNNTNLLVNNCKVSLLSNDQYYLSLKKAIANAKHRIYAEIFIVDLIFKNSTNNAVFDLIRLLSLAVERGVRVRVIIGGSKKNKNINLKSEIAYQFLKQKNIPTRLLSKYDENSSHRKLVTVDDKTFSGSHNWSLGSFTDQNQDSILISDSRISSYFAVQIAKKWLRLKINNNV